MGVGPAAMAAPARAAAGRRLLLALLVAGGLVAALKLLPLEQGLLDLVAWVRGAGVPGMVVFAVVYVVATVLFLPGAILTLGAGFAYGVLVGTPIVWVAANVGALLAFLLGRTVARDWIAARVGRSPRFAAIDRAVAEEGFRIVLLTRLSPIFPFNVLNYAFGLTRVGLRDYVLGSLLGMLPGTVMYVYLGSLVTSLAELAAGRAGAGTAGRVFYLAGLAATIAVTVYVTRLARRALASTAASDASRS
jgi:uncharacterized membrane protein YdjX (TVP38/TMEM64 family)